MGLQTKPHDKKKKSVKLLKEYRDDYVKYGQQYKLKHGSLDGHMGVNYEVDGQLYRFSFKGNDATQLKTRVQKYNRKLKRLTQ